MIQIKTVNNNPIRVGKNSQSINLASEEWLESSAGKEATIQVKNVNDDSIRIGENSQPINLVSRTIRGESAYELALKNGFQGTLEEWLESLIGKDARSLEYTWDGTKLGIRLEGDLEYEFTDFAAEILVIANVYVHDQIAASKQWFVNHNLGKHPSVTIVDSAGSVVMGDIEYVDNLNVTITFTAEFSGKAYLN